jgi:hypothetical protein
VDLIRPSEIWTSSNYQARKVVLRSTKTREIQTDEPLQQEHEFARKVFGARYNHFFGIPKRWIGANAWFCSELAAAALQKVGHNVVSNRNAEKIWPGHFQHCQVGTEWQDVTDCYDAYVAEVTKGADPHCTDVFARTRYLTNEATFGLYKTAFPLMLFGDSVIKKASDYDAELRALAAEIIRFTKEIKEREKE